MHGHAGINARHKVFYFVVSVISVLMESSTFYCEVLQVLQGCAYRYLIYSVHDLCEGVTCCGDPFARHDNVTRSM